MRQYTYLVTKETESISLCFKMFFPLLLVLKAICTPLYGKLLAEGSKIAPSPRGVQTRQPCSGGGLGLRHFLVKTEILFLSSWNQSLKKDLYQLWLRVWFVCVLPWSCRTQTNLKFVLSCFISESQVKENPSVVGEILLLVMRQD